MAVQGADKTERKKLWQANPFHLFLLIFRTRFYCCLALSYKWILRNNTVPILCFYIKWI